MRSKHTMSLTYQPKKEAVFRGECKQTTRLGWKVKANQKILFHEWEESPYRSKWGRRLEVVVTVVHRGHLWEDGMEFPTIFPRKLGEIMPWNSHYVDGLARKDCIAPEGLSLGLAYKRVLKHLNDILMFDGEEAEVIRWE